MDYASTPRSTNDIDQSNTLYTSASFRANLARARLITRLHAEEQCQKAVTRPRVFGLITVLGLKVMHFGIIALQLVIIGYFDLFTRRL